MVIALAAVALILVLLAQAYRNTVIIGPLDRRFSHHSATAAADQTLEHERVTGKVVPIDMLQHRVDRRVYWQLPPEVRARAPEDVRTVALLAWDHEQVGTYIPKTGSSPGTQGTPAIQSRCTVSLVDESTGVTWAQKTFVGAPPPSEIKVPSYGDDRAKRLLESVVAYISAHCR